MIGLNRRRGLMGGAGEPKEEFNDWLWCTFTSAETLTANITGTKSANVFDRVIVDGVELTMGNSITQELAAGQHKIMWHPLADSVNVILYSVPRVIAPNKGTNQVVNIPEAITNIAMLAMRENPFYGPNIVICRSTTPPVCASDNSINLWGNSVTIYVPDASIETYKAATGWSQYANKIRGLSSLHI